MAKKILVLVGLFLMAVTVGYTSPQPAYGAEPQKTDNTGTHILKLENGLTVLVKRDTRFPLANVRLYVKTGSAHEKPEQAGISHQLEHMVFKGTKKRAPGQTALAIESVGGSLNAATSFDYTVYYVEVPAKELKLGMDVVTDMVFNAIIDPEELASERKVVLAELERGEDTPFNRLFKSVQASMWKGTSYEWPIIGYRKTVKSLTPQKIHRYIKEHYQPQSMLLTIVGDVDVEMALAEAKKLVGEKKNTRAISPTKPFSLPQLHGPTVQLKKGKWNKVYLAAAFPIPHLKSAQGAGLEMLAELLGGDETAYLYRRFKYEKRLVDSIGVSAMTLERSGTMYISATLDEENVSQFWAELMKELAAFTPDHFSDREIERVRLNIEDSLFLSKETLSGLAEKLGYFYLFENGTQSEENYLFALHHVDRAEIGALFSDYIRPEQLAVSILAPPKSSLSASTLKKTTKKLWKASKREQAELHHANKKQNITLPGGSNLILIPDETLPYTALSMIWAGGNADFDGKKEGLASLTAKVLDKGTTSMTATEIEDFLADHAASLGTSAGLTSFSVEAKFPTRFSKNVLPLVEDIILNPVWEKAEVDRAKQDQIAGIKQQEDQPTGLLFRNLFPFLFANAPYSNFTEGTPDSVSAFTAEDTKVFWNAQRTHPFTLAVTGSFDQKSIESFAKAIATAKSNANNSFTYPTVQWNTERNKTLTLPERNQAHLAMAFPIPGKVDLNTSAQLAVLQAALAGQSGLLFRDMRDKQGLGYTVTSLLWQVREGGFLALYIGTSPEKEQQALDGFNKVLEELFQTPLPKKELQRAKSILWGDYYQSHQSLISRSREAAILKTLDFAPDYERILIEKAQAVTPQQIQELVRKYLAKDKAYLIKVLP